MTMTDEEKQVWFAVYGAAFARRNRANGAGQAAHDLVVATNNAMEEAHEAVHVLRERLLSATAAEQVNQGPVMTALKHMKVRVRNPAPQGESPCYYCDARPCVCVPAVDYYDD